MKIYELIEQLQKVADQEKTVTIVCWYEDSDSNDVDTADFELHHADDDWCEYLELYVDLSSCKHFL